MGTPEIILLAKGMLETPRLGLEWQMNSDVLPRGVVKLLFLTLLCVETSLPVGGRVSVQESAGHIDIYAEGKRIQLGNAWKLLQGVAISDFTPAQVQFPLLQSLASALNRPIHIDIAETSLRFSL